MADALIEIEMDMPLVNQLTLTNASLEMLEIVDHRDFAWQKEDFTEK